MHISVRAEFPTAPGTVHALLVDKSFLEEVARESGSTDARVTVNGTSTRSERSIVAPLRARRFTGPTISLDERVEWGPAEPDGGRSGTLQVTAPGQPIHLNAGIRLAAAPEGSLLTISGNLIATIPLFGRKVEELAAPLVTSGLQTQERVAHRRLAG